MSSIPSISRVIFSNSPHRAFLHTSRFRQPSQYSYRHLKKSSANTSSRQLNKCIPSACFHSSSVSLNPQPFQHEDDEDYMTIRKNNDTFTARSSIPNKKFENISQILSRIETSLNNPHTFEVDAIFNDIDILHSRDVKFSMVIPLMYYQQCIDILAKRKDKDKIDELLAMIMSTYFPNFPQVLHKNGITASNNSVLDDDISITSATTNQQQQNKRIFQNIAFQCICSYLKYNQSNEALTLWMRVSNQGIFFTTKKVLEELIDEISLYKPCYVSIAFIQKIHTVMLKYEWNKSSLYYAKMFKILNQYLRYNQSDTRQDNTVYDTGVVTLNQLWTEFESEIKFYLLTPSQSSSSNNFNISIPNSNTNSAKNDSLLPSTITSIDLDYEEGMHVIDVYSNYLLAQTSRYVIENRRTQRGLYKTVSSADTNDEDIRTDDTAHSTDSSANTVKAVTIDSLVAIFDHILLKFQFQAKHRRIKSRLLKASSDSTNLSTAAASTPSPMLNISYQTESAIDSFLTTLSFQSQDQLVLQCLQRYLSVITIILGDNSNNIGKSTNLQQLFINIIHKARFPIIIPPQSAVAVDSSDSDSNTNDTSSTNNISSSSKSGILSFGFPSSSSSSSTMAAATASNAVSGKSKTKLKNGVTTATVPSSSSSSRSGSSYDNSIKNKIKSTATTTIAIVDNTNYFSDYTGLHVIKKQDMTRLNAFATALITLYNQYLSPSSPISSSSSSTLVRTPLSVSFYSHWILSLLPADTNWFGKGFPPSSTYAAYYKQQLENDDVNNDINASSNSTSNNNTNITKSSSGGDSVNSSYSDGNSDVNDCQSKWRSLLEVAFQIADTYTTHNTVSSATTTGAVSLEAEVELKHAIITMLCRFETSAAVAEARMTLLDFINDQQQQLKLSQQQINKSTTNNNTTFDINNNNNNHNNAVLLHYRTFTNLLYASLLCNTVHEHDKLLNEIETLLDVHSAVHATTVQPIESLTLTDQPVMGYNRNNTLNTNSISNDDRQLGSGNIRADGSNSQSNNFDHLNHLSPITTTSSTATTASSSSSSFSTSLLNTTRKPTQEEELLQMRSYAHARLNNLLETLQISDKLRQSGAPIQKATYVWLINTIYHTKPASEKEWKCVKQPQDIIQIILHEWHVHGVELTSASVSQLLKLYGKAGQILVHQENNENNTYQSIYNKMAEEINNNNDEEIDDDSNNNDIKGDYEVSSVDVFLKEMNQFVANTCIRYKTTTNNNSSNKTTATATNNTVYSRRRQKKYHGHKPVPMTSDIARAVIKVYCLCDTNSSNNNNNKNNNNRPYISAALEFIKQLSPVYHFEPTSDIYEPLIHRQVAVNKNITAGEDIFMQMISMNTGLIPTPMILNSFVEGFLARNEPIEGLDYIVEICAQYSHIPVSSPSSSFLNNNSNSSNNNSSSNLTTTARGIKPSVHTMLSLLEYSLQRHDEYEANRVVGVIRMLYTPLERQQAVYIPRLIKKTGYLGLNKSRDIRRVDVINHYTTSSGNSHNQYSSNNNNKSNHNNQYGNNNNTSSLSSSSLSLPSSWKVPVDESIVIDSPTDSINSDTNDDSDNVNNKNNVKRIVVPGGIGSMTVSPILSHLVRTGRYPATIFANGNSSKRDVSMINSSTSSNSTTNTVSNNNSRSHTINNINNTNFSSTSSITNNKSVENIYTGLVVHGALSDFELAKLFQKYGIKMT